MSLFGVRLLDAMHRRDINAAELSRKTNISESNISRYLSGTTEPKLRALLILADALNVSADWLSGNEDIEPESFEIRFGEKELMSIYRTLSLSGKQKVLEFAEYVLNKENKHV